MITFAPMWAVVAMSFFVASRLAYVVGVGAALTREKRRSGAAKRDGVEERFQHFQGWASKVMAADAVGLVVVSLVTHDMLQIGVSRAVLVVTGVIFALIGIGIKLWARARLGVQAYYWRDVFVPEEAVFPDPPGPYRYLQNPMYTVGYLQTYGWALICASKWGLVAAAFAQSAILVFHWVVEKPHYEELVATRES